MNEIQEKLVRRANQLRADLPGAAKQTQSYQLIPVLLCPQKLETVPDLETGGERCRKWAAVFSLSVTDSFSEGPTSSALFPIQPHEILDAESKEALRARLYHEIDVALQMVTEQREMSKPPLSLVQ